MHEVLEIDGARRARSPRWRRRVATAATRIDFFFPVPVDGALAKEMQNLVARFNQENPDIEVTAAYTGTYDETDIKTRAAIKAGKPPALALMSANFITQYHIDDLVEAFDPLVRADGKTPEDFMNEFWPALAGNARVDGKIYGVPFQNSTPLLYYNVEAFQGGGARPGQAAGDLGRLGRGREEADAPRRRQDDTLRHHAARHLRHSRLDDVGAHAFERRPILQPAIAAGRSITTRPRPSAR